MNRAPTIIFRPAIGATRAVGQALMGATNTLDPENLRRVEDVSAETRPVGMDHMLTDLTEIQAGAGKVMPIHDGMLTRYERMSWRRVVIRRKGYFT